MTEERLRWLLNAYSVGHINTAELDELLDYVSSPSQGPQLDHLLQKYSEIIEELEPSDLSAPADMLYERIRQDPRFYRAVDIRKAKKKPLTRIIPYAAAVLFIIGFSLVINYRRQTSTNSLQTVEQPSNNLNTKDAASSKKTILRLSDGRIIDLDQAAGGLVATDDHMQIKLNGTELQYNGDMLNKKGKALPNTIITPKGRQYQIVLPDGSKIWLNTATSLTYPIRFDAKAREVEINGEAYFEVKRASNWPFIVKTKNQRIEVLGTSFNVSAYDDDETTKTTLVTGSVKVSLSEHSAILQPGQRATTQKGNNRIHMDNIDTEEVISWTQNLFVFNNEEISEAMKKISRWYDVQVTYEDGMEGKRIGGTIPRFGRLEELMDALEATHVLHYKMKGGKVIIMK